MYREKDVDISRKEGGMPKFEEKLYVLLHSALMCTTRKTRGVFKMPFFYCINNGGSFLIVRCVHKLHCCAVQWQVSSPVECPHKQEVSQSGLSSASYDSVHDIESVEHQVAVQQ